METPQFYFTENEVKYNPLLMHIITGLEVIKIRNDEHLHKIGYGTKPLTQELLNQILHPINSLKLTFGIKMNNGVTHIYTIASIPLTQECIGEPKIEDYFKQIELMNLKLKQS